MKIKNKFKSGAASFYVVAFSTLILVIIASSFASAIVMEIARSSNDDLSQSAYDAAMAGVEDAKIAFTNYQNCLNTGANYEDKLSDGDEVTCQDIVYWMEHADGSSCDLVARILGRIGKYEEGGEVSIDESTGSEAGENNMVQAYTCAIIQTELDDYRADLSSSNPYRVIKVELEDVAAKSITAVRLSWYSNGSDKLFDYTNMISDASRVGFQSLNLEDASTPPTMALQLIQTADSFTLAQLNGKADDNKTDRATVYLVPTNNKDLAGRALSNDNTTYIGAYNGTDDNVLSAAQIASSNDHMKDYPYAVYCPSSAESSAEYACSVLLNLPEPIGGTRNKDTFMFVVSLPYGQPATDFSLEFLCGEGACPTIAGGSTGSSIARLNKMQVLIDSTGRANDLYRRVEIRLEPANNAFNFPFYAVQLDEKFEKNMQVITEHSAGEYEEYLQRL